LAFILLILSILVRFLPALDRSEGGSPFEVSSLKFPPEKRSEVMSRIRSRDTKPELIVRSMLHQLGYRFTVNGPKHRQFPGRPDILLLKFHTVIFVHDDTPW